MVNDLIIIGAGPAGIAAGLRAKREGLDFLVLERDEPLWTIRETYPEEKPVMKHPPDFQMPDDIWFETCSKSEFLERWEKYWKELGSKLHTKEPVTDIKKTGDVFKVKTPKAEYESRFVILAIGVQGKPRKLGIPGEDQENVHYKLKDPKAYAGKICLVVGGGDTAAETALLLTKYAKKVYMSYRRDKFFRLKPENLEAIENSNIEVIFKSNLIKIEGNKVWIDIDGRKEILEVDHIFLCLGTIPNREFLEGLGLALNELGKLIVNEKQETNIPGLFAAGDVVTPSLITYAVESGWKVVGEIKRRLEK